MLNLRDTSACCACLPDSSIVNQGRLPVKTHARGVYSLLQAGHTAGTKFCTFESTLGYDLNKHALSTSFTANRKWQGKEVELKAAWAEQLGQWVLGALIKPHARHKLAGTYALPAPVRPTPRQCAISCLMSYVHKYLEMCCLTKGTPVPPCLDTVSQQGLLHLEASEYLCRGTSSTYW